MASETIKNIKVKFDVDLKDFEKNMKSVSMKIDTVSKTFKSTANDIQRSGDSIERNSGFDALAKQAEDATDSLKDLTDSVEEAGDELDVIFDLTEAAEEAFEDLNQTVEQTADSMREMAGIEGVTFDLSGAEDMTGMVDEATQALQEAEGQASETAEEMAGIGRNSHLANFSQGLTTAGEALKNVGSAVENAGKKISEVGGKVTDAGKKMTTAVTLPLVGLGTAASNTAMNFEASMNQVAATMGLTAEEIKNGSADYEKLEAAAKEMGATTQFSASQAAEALNYLALAGYDANKSVEMLPKVLNLAAAGGLDLAYASDLVTDSMSALGLSADQADAFIDQMAKTSQKSNTNVAQLGEGMLTVGGTAKILAGGTQELSTALGILADNGIKGSEGGTALRNTILSLTAPTDKARKLMKKLGVNAFDANGNMKPLNVVLGDLNNALSKMSDQKKNETLSELFNKNDLKAVQSLLASTVDTTFDLSGALEELGIDVEKNGDKIRDLGDGLDEYSSKPLFISKAMRELGITHKQASGMYDAFMQNLKGSEPRWEQLSGYIGEAEGAAAGMAETMNSGTKGALTQMSSALEGVAITIGERITPYIEMFAGKVMELCDWFQNLSPEMQDNIVKWGAIIAAIGPAIVILGTVITLIGKVVSIVGTLIKVGGSVVAFFGKIGTAFAAFGGWLKAAGTAIATFVGGISWPVVAIVAAIGAVVAAIIWLWNNWDVASKWIATAWEWLKNVFITIGKAICDGLVMIGEFFVNIFTGIGDFIVSIGTFIVNAIQSFLTGCHNVVMTILTGIKNFFVAIFNGICDFIGGILEVIKNIIVGYLEFQLKKWQFIFNAIYTVVSTIFNAIKKAVETITTGISTFVTHAWDNMKNMVTNFAQGLKDGVMAAFNGLKSGVLGIWEGIKNGIKGCVNGIIGVVNKMIGGLNKINVDVPDWVPALGGKSIGFNIPSIPLLATGGQVDFGTAIVGEAGPELLQQTAHGTKVTPLSTHEKAGGISGALGGGFTVRIDKFINNTDRDIEELSYRLADHFQKNMKGRGLSYE